MTSNTLERNQSTIHSAGVTSIIESQQLVIKLHENKSKLISYIRENIIGSHHNTVLRTVFGEKPQVYTDYTASGKSLHFIENYIRDTVMPLYANTHSRQSQSGKQTVYAREEARHIIKRSCNANENDAMIFCGTGATTSVNLFVKQLGIQKMVEQIKLVNQMTEILTPDQLETFKTTNLLQKKNNYCKQNRWQSFDCTLCNFILASEGAYEMHAQSEQHIQAEKKNYKNTSFTDMPVCFLSIYEHNSNLLPWRETGAKIELIPLTDEGDFDYEFLHQRLAHYSSTNCLKVGSFSAGSNITGTLVDVDRIAIMCHQFQCLASFDYAAVAPYVEINMNGVSQNRVFKYELKNIELAYKDAIHISPHKFVGGPGSSGVLIVKKNAIGTQKPDRIGGGPVFFVNELDHHFRPDIESLEEAGTPGVIQDIRAGLVFQLKEQISSQTIHDLDQTLMKKALKRFFEIENLFLLGNNNLHKVPIFSFVVKSRYGKLLNPHFVTSLLNDIFGIQSRSGCSCAAMYGQKILGLDLELSRQYKKVIFEGHEMFRMGYTRINLPWFFTDEDLEYIIQAVEFVCKFGWMFLPLYKFDKDQDIWVNRNEKEQSQRIWLGENDYSSGELQSKTSNLREKMPFKIEVTGQLADYIELAKHQLVNAVQSYKQSFGKSSIDAAKLVPEQHAGLVWWLFPNEVQQELQKLKNVTFKNLEQETIGKQSGLFQTPFIPKDYNNSKFKFQFSDEYLNLHSGIVRQVEPAISLDAPVIQITIQTVDQEPSCTQEQGFPFMDMDEEVQPVKKEKVKLIKIPFAIQSLVGGAMRDFDMIKDGDRVLVAISGGKDSLCLVHILKHFQSVAPIKFDIGGVTIDPMVVEYQPKPLIPYMASINVPYFIESDAIVERARLSMQKNSICSFCSRMKRGMIYNCARREGYNVIAMGQHLDDLAESFVMSSFHNGQLRTMKANYTIDKKDLRVIRPLVTCREKLFKDFSDSVKLPVISDNCPACFSAPKERHRVKLMLAQQEQLFPDLFQHILKTILPLMRINIRDLIKSTDQGDSDEEAEAQLVNTCNPISGACPLMK